MIIRWLDLSVDQIMDVALENIGRKLSSVKLSLLYGTTDPRTAVATYELSMQEMSAFPEYGCNLMFSDHYLNIIREEAGDYFLFPFKTNAVYLIRDKDVMGNRRVAQNVFAAAIKQNGISDDEDILSRRVLHYGSDGMEWQF